MTRRIRTDADTRALVRRLWDEATKILTAAHTSEHVIAEHRAVLRDYAHDGRALMRLFDAEAVEERAHRRFTAWGTRWPLSVGTAAKLTLLHNMARGAKAERMPDALDFLTYRRTAVEARCLGFMACAVMPDAWIEEADALDYAAAVDATTTTTKDTTV